MMNYPVQPNDVFQKTSGSPSKWIVERIIEFPDIPPHVRLNEQSGNERTITVAMAILLDARQWRMIQSAPRKGESEND